MRTSGASAGQIAQFQGDGFFVTGIVPAGVTTPKTVDAECAELGRKVRFGHFFERRRGVTLHDSLGEPLLLPL